MIIHMNTDSYRGASLLGLPNEVKEEMFAQISNKRTKRKLSRQRDLHSLSGSCKLLHLRAQEYLMKHPIVCSSNIASFLRTRLANPSPGMDTESIEIVPGPQRLCPLGNVIPDVGLRNQCRRRVQAATSNSGQANDWWHLLMEGREHWAYLALLLVMFPSITELYLDGTQMNEYPFLSGLITEPIAINYASSVCWTPAGSWHKDYLGNILDIIANGLTAISLPSRWILNIDLLPIASGLRRLFQVRHLEVPFYALSYGQVWGISVTSLILPQQLPPSLEELVILHEPFPNGMRIFELLDNFVRDKDTLSRLAKIEVRLEQPWWVDCFGLQRVERIVGAAKQRGIGVYIWPLRYSPRLG